MFYFCAAEHVERFFNLTCKWEKEKKSHVSSFCVGGISFQLKWPLFNVLVVLQCQRNIWLFAPVHPVHNACSLNTCIFAETAKASVF